MKLGHYKSVYLPLLVYGRQCVELTKTDLTVLKNIQKWCIKWIAAVQTRYELQLKLLNLLLLSKHLQRYYILLLRKLTSGEVRKPKLTESETKKGRAHELLTVQGIENYN